MSVVPALKETAVTTVPAPCQGSLSQRPMSSCYSTCSQSKFLIACMDQAGPGDEQVKWPGRKGSVGLQGPALGRSGSLSRRAGVGGSGDPGSPGHVRMHMEVRLSVLQWGCCSMSS